MNREAYDAIALEWDAVRHTSSTAEQRLIALALEGLAPGAAVLDLGCGTGRPIGEYVLARGFALTGVDQSARMMQLARERLPQGDWIEAALETFVPTGTYSAAIAWDSLFHIARETHEGIFRRVRKALLPRSRFVQTVGGSAHPAFTDTMFSERFYYDSHPPDKAMALLRVAGFEVIHSEFLSLPTGGRDKGRFAIVASVADT